MTDPALPAADLGDVPTRIGYLGPPGTNTEEALRSQPDLVGAELVPLGSIRDVIEAVVDGTLPGGMVPVENSIDGSVAATLDLLAADIDVLVRREVVIPVDLNLCARPGVDLAALTRIHSHPTANAQSRGTLNRLVPAAMIVPENSTAEAAAKVAALDEPVGAVATRLAAELHGLEILAADIADMPDAETRFFLLGRTVPPRTGADKTSVRCHLSEDRPGSLLAILQEFAARGLNLTKVESRPTKAGLGEYLFFIDIEGHIADALVQDALRGLKYRFGSVRFLGSYPRARRGGIFEEEAEEAAWAAAGDWVDDMAGRIER